jgi:pectate lyase
MSTDHTFLDVVRAFADNALTHGRDRWGPQRTPLFADGLNVQTLAPVEWVCDGQRWIVCNPASQQDFYRTLVGLSNLTGQPRYRQAATEATLFFLERYVDSNGLPKWGGHRFVDLHTGDVVGEQNHHEFKTTYPFYEFLHEIAPRATERLIRALWNAHVYDWSNLDMSRHGVYDAPMSRLWDEPYVGGEVFFHGRGLTFINAGSDLIYAGGMLHHFTKDPGALTWTKRLAHRYVEARDPKTKLGAYQYSQPAVTLDPATAGTLSGGGDRARRQFGPEFGERALEGKLLAPYHAERVYGHSAATQMQIAELLGGNVNDDGAGADLIRWAHEGLLAFAAHAYDPATNALIPMFTDGTRLTPADVKRPGYYKPSVFEPRPASSVLLFSFAQAYRITRDAALWPTVCALAKGHELGDIGGAPGAPPHLNGATNNADPVALFALLEIARATGDAGFLKLARTIGDNIVRLCYREGLFLESSDYVNASFNSVAPLALLTFEAAVRGEPDAVPRFTTGQPRIHGPHDGLGRTKDDTAIWSRKHQAK